MLFLTEKMPKLIFCTHNIHKIKEIRSLMPQGYAILSLKDIDVTDSVDEVGETFHENAFLKVGIGAREEFINAFAEDSGLCVEALHGAPGVHSARYAGEGATDAMNRALLLKNMEHVTNRNAYFITVICLKQHLGQLAYFEGRINGTIALEERGKSGFGYDSLFIPEGQERTFAEMQPDEKSAISHRNIALQKMLRFLKSLKN